MKKIKNYVTLFILLNIFAFLFIFSRNIKLSVLASTELWIQSLVPSMLPLYTILDLLINYGLGTLLYKIFKTNSALLLFISLISGSPGNAKYVKEFLSGGYISSNSGNLLLACGYSPNPLFILAISKSTKDALFVLLYIYGSNFINFLIFRKKLQRTVSKPRDFQRNSFSQTIETSINKSFNVLILILGIIVIYGILNTILSSLYIDSPIIYSILEMTNALNIINLNNLNIFWFIFAASFGGLSIHTQIKSILEGTEASYKYFLYGRLIASLPSFILALIYS